MAPKLYYVPKTTIDIQYLLDQEFIKPVIGHEGEYEYTNLDTGDYGLLDPGALDVMKRTILILASSDQPL